eukprot:9827356-Alexandrium_andersonii.AAC.1
MRAVWAVNFDAQGCPPATHSVIHRSVSVGTPSARAPSRVRPWHQDLLKKTEEVVALLAQWKVQFPKQPLSLRDGRVIAPLKHAVALKEAGCRGAGSNLTCFFHALVAWGWAGVPSSRFPTSVQFSMLPRRCQVTAVLQAFVDDSHLEPVNAKLKDVTAKPRLFGTLPEKPYYGLLEVPMGRLVLCTTGSMKMVFAEHSAVCKYPVGLMR